MKKLLSLLLCVLLCVSFFAIPAFAATVTLSPQNLTVDGKSIDCEKYNIDGSNYFKLRDIAYLLNGTGSQFSVGWDGSTGTVAIKAGEAYIADGSELVIGSDKSSTAAVSTQTITVDGSVRSDLSVYNIGGNNYFKLRDLGAVLSFDVDFDSSTNTALIASQSQYYLTIEVSSLSAEVGESLFVTLRHNCPGARVFSSSPNFENDTGRYSQGYHWYDYYSTFELTGLQAGDCIIQYYYDSGNGLVYSDQVKITFTESTKNQAAGIYIFATGMKINPVGGAIPSIYFKNVSDKTIKYVNFTVTPYNAVGDVIYSSIGRKSTATLSVTGPIAPFDLSQYGAYYFYHRSPNAQEGVTFEVYSLYDDPYIYYGGQKYYLDEYERSITCNMVTFDPVWYNSTTSYIHIDTVKIDYMDGTSETISNPRLGIWDYEPYNIHQ